MIFEHIRITSHQTRRVHAGVTNIGGNSEISLTKYRKKKDLHGYYKIHTLCIVGLSALPNTTLNLLRVRLVALITVV